MHPHQQHRRTQERAFWGAVGADEARRRKKKDRKGSAAPTRGPIGQLVEFVVAAMIIWGVIELLLAFQRH
ncbi:hypothetical protein H4P1_00019 (plasmid) [Variovorax sp. PBS-H4]|uniref:hypothetical protein n=1 Tax=Variovorax sp. PBS-H4 TaxID=434008 RepID=UPI0013188683|nr:hypothetical protein [Variovorax sp. PBS-H4]VTU41387.1 hypothetical protein H4P1_00019 [Variovorax sp. PBS-H4]